MQKILKVIKISCIHKRNMVLYERNVIMNSNKNKEIFFNRAEIEKAEQICCENCFEQVVFMLKDKNHEFSMGLTTILECLKFAIENGDLPKLPLSWVNLVYGDSISEISYYDEEHNKKRYANEVFQDKSRKNS